MRCCLKGLDWIAKRKKRGCLKRQPLKKASNNGSRLLRKSRLSAYNLVVNQNHTQVDFTLYETGRQLKLPMETEIYIAADDPVRLVSAVVERMDIRKIERSYSQDGRNEYPPRILLKVLIYGYMRMIYSSRGIERACRENICFMYLLEDNPVPDHNTIARFRSQHLVDCEKELLEQFAVMLMKWGFVSMATVFIDGTKIEANANRYSFVWKKSVEKHLAKLKEQIGQALSGLVSKLGLKWHIPETIQIHHLKKLRKKLYAKAEAEKLEWVTGKGHRKPFLQKAIEMVSGWLERWKKYTQDLHICGDRNSYCKTDHDATFMHMKEDHMRNGQLKPGYNVNVATSEEFIIGNYISADRNDVHTLIPFMEYLKRYPILRLCVDSGYESEENYCYFEENKGTKLYVKPSNHEQKKTKKYRTDISRRENMSYDAEKDTYTCANLCLQLQGLCWLSIEGEVHPRLWEQKAAGGKKQGNLCFQALCQTAGRNGATDQHRRGEADSREPQHSGRGRLCHDEGRHALSQIPAPQHCKG